MISKLKPLLLPFLICLCAELYFPLLFPSVRFLGFAPLITIIIARFRLPTALWLSSLLGIVVDLYSWSSVLGIFALNNCVTVLATYRYRKFFLEEKIHIFALYSVIFSFVSTLIYYFLFALTEIPLQINFFTCITDLLLMPIFDGVYALICVLFPITAWVYLTNLLRFQFFKNNYLRHIQVIKTKIRTIKIGYRWKKNSL